MPEPNQIVLSLLTIWVSGGLRVRLVRLCEKSMGVTKKHWYLSGMVNLITCSLLSSCHLPHFLLSTPAPPPVPFTFPSISSFIHLSFPSPVHRHISLRSVLTLHLPFLLFPPSGSQFTGFPGHVVASQRKLAQHSAINNWGGPTWPGTLSLNGLFWEGSMPACESFIRACRWNVQGHRQCSSLSVLILPSSRVTLSTPPPFSSSPPPFCYPPTPADDPATPQEHSGSRFKVQFWIKHKWPSKTVYESFILYDDLECDAGE